MRWSPKVEEVLPVLYLRGLSPADLKEALGALLGDKASGLSASSIGVDGMHFRVRHEEDRLGTLVLLGLRSDGTK